MKSDVYNPDPNHICMWFEIRLKSGLESINGQIGFHVVFFFFIVHDSFNLSNDFSVHCQSDFYQLNRTYFSCFLLV